MPFRFPCFTPGCLLASCLPVQYRKGLINNRPTFLQQTIKGNSLLTLFILAFSSIATVAQTQSVVTFPTVNQSPATPHVQSVTVNIQNAGTLDSIGVVTQGNANKDFTDNGSDGCTVGTAYTANSSCTVNVQFQPTAPGGRYGAVVLTLTNNGNTFTVAQFLYGLSMGSVGVIVPGEINTVAGTGLPTYVSDGTPTSPLAATQAPIGLPQGEAVDAAGNLYIADSFNNRIRKVDTSGNITTYVGNGEPGSSGDGGPAANATITKPSGLVLDGAGNLYFADDGSNVIRMVDTTSQHTITTIAGTANKPGYNGPSFGDPTFNSPQPLSGMLLNQPNGLALDANQNLYVADSGNNLIRVINLNANPMTITTIAGAPAGGFGGDGGLVSTAIFDEPWGIAYTTNNGTGSFLYVADVNNNIIRRLDLTPNSGLSSTVAGTQSHSGSFNGDSPTLATQAQLNNPEGVVIDLAGNLYIADTENHRIRKVNAQSSQISTLAGSTQGFLGDGQNSGANTQLNFPSSVVLDASGNLYIGDEFNNRVREIDSGVAILNYGQIKNYQISSPQAESFENDGNATLSLLALAYSNAALDSTMPSTCASVTTLTLDQSCTLEVDFAPQVLNLPAGGAITPGTLTISSNAANSSGAINLVGDVLTVNPTTTTVTSSTGPPPSASAFNIPLIFTATVTNSGNGPLTGSVNFFDGGVQIGTSNTIPSTTINNGTATFTFTTSTLALGSHNITAVFVGDLNNAPSPVSPIFVQLIKSGTTLALTSNPSTSTFPANVVFTATLTGATNPVTGTVTFFEGMNALASSIPVVGGIATFSPASPGFAPGTHTITAVFSGDTNNLTSSATTTQIVQAATTSTMLSTSNQAPTFGAPVTFTATVVNNASSVIGETVTFLDGLTPIGTGTLIANGAASIASFSTSSLVQPLTPGPHSIMASYPGDTNNAASTSTAIIETIKQIATSTTVTSSLNPSNEGAPLSFTAIVSPAGGTAIGGSVTGTVTFSDGGTVIGSQAVVPATGSATLSLTTPLTVGAHQITATYNSGVVNSNYANSLASPVFVQTIDQNTTTTTLTSSSAENTSTAGKSVTLTAVVAAPPGSPTPQGGVTFSVTTKQGTTVLGPVQTLNAAGQATFQVATLPVGTDTITAAYSDQLNANYGNSSATLNQVVNIAITSISLSAPPSPTTVGSPITLTATLTGTGGPLTGTINFEDGGAIIDTFTIVNGASPVTATFTTSSLNVGSHVLTAIYSGDSNNSPSTPSPSVTMVVQQITTTTTLTSSANPGALNQSLTLTANVANTSGSIAPGGTVSFQDGATVIGTVGLSANGVASLPISTLSLGNHSIVANYLGDTDHSASQSAALRQQILQPTSIALTTSGSPSTAETPVTFTATLTSVQSLQPTGTVTFKDGANILGAVNVSNGVAAFTTSSLTVGSHSIVASYSGDTNYQPISSTTLPQTVQIANTSVTLTSSANPATANTSLVFTAVVKGTGGAITGTVTFEDGTTVLARSAVNSGVATFTTTSLSPGQHTITAVYGGDSNNTPNTSAILQQQVQQVTVASLASSANPSPTLSPITITCTITNGGTQHATGSVTFTDGSTALGSALLDANGVATLNLPSLAAGQHSIVATYTGDVADFPSTSAPFTQAVQLRPTTDVLTATTTSLTNGQQLTLISVVRWTGPVAPTGSVNFTIGNTVIGTATVDSVGVATLTIILDPGAATITSSYSGDSAYSASTSPATPITDGPPTSFTMQLSSTAVSLVSKQNTTVNLTLTSLNGFSDTLTLGCLGLPFAATCTFTTDQSSLAANGTQTVHLVIDTGSPLTSGSVATAANRSTEGTSSKATLCFLPCGALLGWLLMKSRKHRPLTGLLLVLCSLGLAIGLSGCGSLNQSGTPPGTYSFKITASGLKTGVTQSTDMTLTVTQ